MRRMGRGRLRHETGGGGGERRLNDHNKGKINAGLPLPSVTRHNSTLEKTSMGDRIKATLSWISLAYVAIIMYTRPSLECCRAVLPSPRITLTVNRDECMQLQED